MSNHCEISLQAILLPKQRLTEVPVCRAIGINFDERGHCREHLSMV